MSILYSFDFLQRERRLTVIFALINGSIYRASAEKWMTPDASRVIIEQWHRRCDRSSFGAASGAALSGRNAERIRLHNAVAVELGRGINRIVFLL